MCRLIKKNSKKKTLENIVYTNYFAKVFLANHLK